MSAARKNVLFAGLGRYVAKEYEVGSKLGTEKSNRQLVVEVSLVRMFDAA
jgi:hypothetical protein